MYVTIYPLPQASVVSVLLQKWWKCWTINKPSTLKCWEFRFMTHKRSSFCRTCQVCEVGHSTVLLPWQCGCKEVLEKNMIRHVSTAEWNCETPVTVPASYLRLSPSHIYLSSYVYTYVKAGTARRVSFCSICRSNHLFFQNYIHKFMYIPRGSVLIMRVGDSKDLY